MNTCFKRSPGFRRYLTFKVILKNLQNAAGDQQICACDINVAGVYFLLLVLRETFRCRLSKSIGSFSSNPEQVANLCVLRSTQSPTLSGTGNEQ